MMYEQQHMVLASRERRRGTIAAGRADLVYLQQLGGYAAYSVKQVPAVAGAGRRQRVATLRSWRDL